MGKIPATASEATLIADLPGGAIRPERAADLALGAQLRAYAFDRYKTKRKEEEEKAAKLKVTIAVAGVAAAATCSPAPRTVTTSATNASASVLA